MARVTKNKEKVVMFIVVRSQRKSLKVISIIYGGKCMEYDCHIFSKCVVFQIKKPNILIEIPSIWIINQIIGFSHLEFEILAISREISSISKTWNFH